MAHWTTTLDGSWFGLTSGSDRWTPPAAERPSIPAALRANENAAAYLARLLLTDGRIVLHIEDDQSGGLSQGVVNLSSAFTSGGTIQLEAAGASFRVALADEDSADTQEPYDWRWNADDGGSDITAMRRALPGAGTDAPATLTLWDGEDENPFADTTAPTLESAATSADGAAVELTFDEDLDADSIPAAAAFAVTVAGAARGVSAVARPSARVIRLTLESAVAHGEAVTAAYTKPSANPLQDAAGNEVATFAAQSVSNTVPGAIQFAELALTLHHAGTNRLGATDTWRNRASVQSEGGIAASYLRQDSAGDVYLGGTGFDFGDGTGNSTWTLAVPQFIEGVEGVPWTIEKADGTVLLTIETPPAYDATAGRNGAGGYTETVRNPALFDALTAEATAGRDLVFRISASFAAHELAPRFAGSGSGAFTATLTHQEAPETIELAPRFAGSGSGAFTATLTHQEAPETIELAPRFAGSGMGTLTIAELVHFMGEVYELAPAFAGSGSGILAASLVRREPADHQLAPAFAGSGSGVLAALLRHQEASETIRLRPAFAGSGMGALTALLTHGEVAEQHTLRGLRFTGTGRGALAVRLVIDSLSIFYEETKIALSPPTLGDEPLRIVTCIEITHPEADAPIRLVDDGQDVVIGSATYLAARFEAQTVGDGGQSAPRGQLLIGNVGRQVSQWIEGAGGGAGGQARVMDVLLAGGGATVQWELTMDITSIATEENVTVGLGFDPLLGRPAVAMRYDPQTAPGLF